MYTVPLNPSIACHARFSPFSPFGPFSPLPFLVAIGLWTAAPALAQAPSAAPAAAQAPLVAGAESPDQAQIDFANGLFQRGLFKEATEEYRAYLKAYPQGAQAKTAMYRLGESAAAAQDYKGALESFEGVLAAGSDDSTRQQALLGKGEALYFLKRPADAALALEPLAAAGVAAEIRARALYTLGKIHTESGDTDAALKAFKALIGELPRGVPENLVPYITQTAIGLRDELKVFGDDYNTPDGSCIRDYLHVVDLAKAHVIAVKRLMENKNKHDYEVFNLGTGKGVSVLEAIKSFERVSGIKLKYKIAGRRAGDIEKIWADPSLANRELGWKTISSLDDAMKTAWEWEKTIRNKK